MDQRVWWVQPLEGYGLENTEMIYPSVFICTHSFGFPDMVEEGGSIDPFDPPPWLQTLVIDSGSIEIKFFPCQLSYYMVHNLRVFLT